MRLLFFSAFALTSVSAIMPLQGSAAKVGVVSSRSSLDVPSLFAVRNNPPSPTSAVFGIPRGGARDVAKANAPVKVTSISGGELNLPSDIFSKEKLGWTISLAINLAYLFFFFKNNYFTDPAPAPCLSANGGFCVTGLLPDGSACKSNLWNSHTWAFMVDMVFTYLGLQAKTNRSKIVQYGLVFTIFSHGLLHAALGLLVKCAGVNIPGGDEVFMAFAAVISFAVLFVSAQFENNDFLKKLGLSAFGGWLTLQLAGTDGENGSSSIFLITQILASLSVVFFPGNNIQNMEELGHSFVFPCLISLIELVYCCNGNGGASLFNKLGGHVWYDIFLHRSVLLAIENGVEKEE
eukprot:CAMPEP_0183704164 /NCGR_PEP_ID=MMETSP0737-20130205/1594_1 /TAXON_ID=385413 /ORGANISM="Thalassiosira miniscula, Strain CCMP1093" /LENGTH=348 /DNA_ID=CAMNT_0025930985 /DNA_START=93 /DNA_END=1139 /DNA_ORIENTATION=+